MVFSYPRHLDPFPREWIDELLTKSEEELWAIDGGNPDSITDPQLKELFLSLREIEKFPQLEKEISTEAQRYPSWAFFKVRNKKQHEIEKIIQLITNQDILKDSSKIVDIGGGQGHLGRILSYYHGHNVTVIDREQEFLDLGVKRAKKYPAPEQAGELKFKKFNFGEGDDFDHKIDIDERTLTLGLHTCGPLAHRHFDQLLHSKGQSLINFGCCYNRIDAQKEIPLSQAVKEEQEKANISLSDHSLTLATRGHQDENLKAFQLKMKVKYFRCALHIYLYENYQFDDFVAVGSEHPRVYQGPFSEYAYKKLKGLDIEVDKNKLDEYYNDPKTQQIIKEMFVANVIRWQFGRALEKWILFDRALYLEEKGLQVNIFELFDRSLSPRNIGISAIKKS
ncbi:MAG: methyltransferase [Oligoflexia bacterium]|nr:methyltransferase [Oligoflexia bacterium]